MALPKKIYVCEQKESNGKTFLLAYHNPAEWDEDGRMGVYTLGETIQTRHKVEVTVEPKKRAKKRL